MIEGQFKAEFIEAGRDSSVLRQLRWTDLVARLAATRDLKREMERPCETGFAGFSTALPELSEEEKRRVNHDALSDGKSAEPKAVGVANGAAQGDRE